MKLLKNHTFAVILTVIVILGCCAYGFFTRPNQTAADLGGLEYGRENYAAYLDWIADEENLLSDKTKQSVAVFMAAMDKEYGSIVTVVTEASPAGASLEDRANAWAEKGQLSGGDMVLLIDTTSDNWYMLPGADIARYVDGDLQAIVTSLMSSGSITANADKVLPELFEDLYSWYQDTLTPVSSTPSATAAVGLFVLVVVLIFVVFLFLGMGVGRRSYGYGFWGPFWGPIFFPGRFPGGPVRRPPLHHDHDRHDHWGGFGGGGFGGGGFGGGGFGGGGRGGGFGGGGGGFGGGGFGGGGRGGGFGG